MAYTIIFQIFNGYACPWQESCRWTSHCDDKGVHLLYQWPDWPLDCWPPRSQSRVKLTFLASTSVQLGLLLAQRCRRWLENMPILCQCLIYDGLLLIHSCQIPAYGFTSNHDFDLHLRDFIGRNRNIDQYDAKTQVKVFRAHNHDNGPVVLPIEIILRWIKLRGAVCGKRLTFLYTSPYEHVQYNVWGP